MNQTLAVWLLIALAIVSANLPFLTDKVGAIWEPPQGKTIWWRLLELLVFYMILGAAGFGFEAALGNRFNQTWEFYAITGSLFLVAGFPGFAYRYLFRKPMRTTSD